MGGSSKKQTVGYRYFFGIHMGIGRGPVDALHEIRVADKQAWYGRATGNTTIQIKKPELFGGEEKEGGVAGPLELMMGAPDQEASSGLKAMLGGVLPGFRGAFTAFYNGLVCMNNPYPKPWKFRLNRVLNGWDGAAWYPSKAQIPLVASSSPPQLISEDNLVLRLPEMGYDKYNVPGWPMSDSNGLEFAAYQTNGSFSNCVALAPSRPSFDIGEGEDFSIEFKCFLESTSPSYSLARHILFGRIWVRATNYSGGYVIEDAPWFFVAIDNQVRFESEIAAQIGCPARLNQWVKYKVERIGTVLRMYEDDVVVVTTSCTTAALISSVPITVNGPYQTYSPLPNNWGNGVIQKFDELRIYRSGNNVTPEPCAMNPAHIIYECLTNRVWGRGLSASKLDLNSFLVAADALHAENFGLCLKWTRKDSIENFVQGVVDHIGATLYVSRTTKLYTMKLIRGGYNLNDLPLFDTESGILSISDASVASIGSTVNAVQVKYHDWENDEERTVSVKNSAAIVAAGGVVNQVTRDFPGIPVVSLALRVAQRELRAVSTALRKFTITMDRRGEDFAPGDVLAIQDPKRGIPKMAVRVGRVEDGTLLDGKITLTVVQDVFTLPATTMAADVPSTWVPPNNTPCIDQQRVFEAPYFLMARTMTKADLDYVGPDSGHIATLNSRGQPLNQGHKIAVRPDAPTVDDNPPNDNYVCGI